MMDSYLNIISLAVSIGGLVAAIRKAPRRDVVMAILLSVLVVLSIAKSFDYVHHLQAVLTAEKNIEALLSDQARTVDQLHDELHYVPLSTLTEGLYRAVDAGRVIQRVIELKSIDGSALRVRVYSIAPGKRVPPADNAYPSSSSLIVFPAAPRAAVHRS